MKAKEFANKFGVSVEEMDIFDVYKLKITNDGLRSQIYIEIWRD